ncbi:predicted protein [Streptomyces viridosporus ATCC 14672]|uniref:Predicted protein n=1 Tax=Streptomyces viridosporus (strain ATCC 14672 / DSM 40746 / JCM 4963 / KCTC 9882 / NRRL B-12104 / FH 1290) TaxID=566461 RepID=D6A8H1_STRV1|nr:predicted protein [Streptomyces viridosporus ATCC 14672]
MQQSPRSPPYGCLPGSRCTIPVAHLMQLRRHDQRALCNGRGSPRPGGHTDEVDSSTGDGRKIMTCD